MPPTLIGQPTAASANRTQFTPAHALLMTNMKLSRVLLAAATLTPTGVGQQWQQLASSQHPSHDAALALADDYDRGRLVCFATGFADPTASTWEWDGSRWLRRRTAVVPAPVGERVATTYDPVRRRVVMVERTGGTWWFDGDDWQELATARMPIWNDPTLWFDPVRGTTCAIDYSDVYELQGGSWLPLAQLPGSASRHTATYDAIRGVAVVVGGNGATGLLDTWIWNGTTLSLRAPANPISFRTDFLMTFDALTGRVLLLGGRIGSQSTTDGFGWNGSNWSPEPALPRPIAPIGRSAIAPRSSGPALLTPIEPGAAAPSLDAPDLLQRNAVGTWSTAFVPSTAAVAIAFHAGNGATIAVDGDRTMAFDGFAWSDTGVPFPPAAGAIAMAYHAGTARTIAIDAAAGVWSWDGNAWSAVTATPKPAARNSTSMAYDASRNRIMLFGGQVGGQYLTDTWEWDGSSWTSWPSASNGLSLAHIGYDPNGQRMVLQKHFFPQYTYAWNGGQWLQISLGAPPTGSIQSTLAPRLGTSPTDLFLVCRSSPGPDQTFRLVGDTWQPALAPLPSGDPNGTLLYHPRRGALILHDGRTRRDVILSPIPAAANRLGNGCSGGSGAARLVAADLPQLGIPMRTDVLDGTANEVAFLLADLTTTNVPLGGGCVQLLPNPILLGAAPTNAAGFCSFTWTVPTNSALRGVLVFEHALVTAPNGPLGGFAGLTNGLSLRLGD